MRLDSGNRLAFAERTDYIDMCLCQNRLQFATKCATGGDGWGELVGVWGRGLLAVGSVVVCLRDNESVSASK